jgi:TniQ
MSLVYFPQPYPDELLYSLLARWRQHVGLPHNTDATAALFGSAARSNTQLDLPFQLIALAKNIPTQQNLSVDRLIDEHTLFPYFSSFVSNDRAMLIRKAMSVPDGNPYNYLSPRIRGRDQVIRLRFCAICFAQMKAKYGEPYWKRSHQLPLSFLCDTHGTPLIDSDVALSKYRNSYTTAALSCAGSSTAWATDLNLHSLLILFATGGAELLRIDEKDKSIMRKAIETAESITNLPRELVNKIPSSKSLN